MTTSSTKESKVTYKTYRLEFLKEEYYTFNVELPDDANLQKNLEELNTEIEQAIALEYSVEFEVDLDAGEVHTIEVDCMGSYGECANVELVSTEDITQLK